jgi:type IV secretory pathway ATPase VirB11/archaellum biosynthesis ATPase
LSEIEIVADNTAEVIAFFIRAAAAGHSARSARLIADSPSAQALEALVVALRMDAGEDVSVAVEIKEVAQDLVKRIREAREGKEKG